MHTHARILWKGVECIQNPVDLFMLQKLATDARAETIVELGTYKGGTALFLADAGFEVVTIDRVPTSLDKYRVYAMNRECYTEETRNRVLEIVAGRRVMVIDDASHAPVDVEAGLRLYTPLVSQHSFYVVMDTIIDQAILNEPVPMPGLLTVIEEFVDRHHGSWSQQNSPFQLSNAYHGILRKNA